MKLEPFVRVDGLPFSATRDDVLRDRGRPASEARNDVGLHELDYRDAVYRFQDGGRLEEVTLRAPVVHFGAVAVPFGALESFIREHDPSMFERAGFVVSPAFGLAFVPAEPCWVTALARHAIGPWRAL